MKTDGLRSSSNVEDRRRGGGGGGRGAPVKLSGGVIVVVLVVSALTGTNPLTLLGQLSSGGSSSTSTPSAPPGDDRAAQFVAKVLATTEDTWRGKMPGYREPKLVLFRDSVSSACGHATAAVGPFYCPADHKAYLDLTFFDDLASRFGAPGDFAAAYVVAHEIGHHVQNLEGTSAKVSRSGDNEGATSMGVRLELQADCYAGVWAFDAQKRGLLEVGDVDEALRAAHQIGDDTLQKRGRGRVTPDSFTHGSSAQRAKWFKVGMSTGDPRRCDTFATRDL
jgi:predicted metalloprotease